MVMGWEDHHLHGNGTGWQLRWMWVFCFCVCVCVATEVFVVIVLGGNLLRLSAEYVTFMSMANGDSVLRCFSSDGMPANRIHKLALSLNAR